ncbi:MAG TPA: hypothetical protein VFV68_10605, partial [Agriterribacter sp.]|nr:hypothetical protein [Agriterribacter sp.]
VVLGKKAALYFPGMRPGKWITAGDISWDGKKIIVKSLQKVFYWQRKKNEPVWQALLRPVTELPYLQEPQGESICFNGKANAYYTVSEGENQPVYYYKISKKDLKRSQQ